MGRARTLPTVAVNRDGNKVIINKSDFDPEKDKLWEDSSVHGGKEGLEPEPEEVEQSLKVKRRLSKKT